MPIIVENFNLTELKEFLTSQSLDTTYTCSPRPQDFYIYTTPNGMDYQSSYSHYEVGAKFWIQYFPLADTFSLNVNFFATLDGSAIGEDDFIEKVPTAIKPYEYYNSPKIQWVRQNEIYIKQIPENCPFNVYPNIQSIVEIQA